MKRFLVIIFTVVFVCVAAVVVAPSFIDWSAYKGQAAQQVADKTGLEMDVNGDLGFSIIPSPRFFIEDVSIKAPEGSKNEIFASLERLDINVALMPLFSKQLKVNSLTAIKPIIALEALENGKLNIMTEKLEAMSSGEETESQAGASTQKISLDKIRIKDGAFTYYDHKSKAETKIQNINLDLSAGSLTGPFKAQGSLFYSGQALNFDAQADNYDAESKIISPKVKLILQPGDIALHYEGVVSFDDALSVQGQTGLHIGDVVKMLSEYNISAAALKSGAMTSTGLLTADAKSLDYKNVAFTYNNQNLNGDLSVTFSPLSYKLKLKTPEDFKISEITSSGYGFENAAMNIDVSGSDGKTSIDKSWVQLDGQKIDISGSYKTDVKTNKSNLGLSISSPKIDYDKLAAKLPKSSSGNGSLKQSIASLALPVDLDLKANIAELIWQKKNIKGISLNAKTAGSALTLDNLSIKDFGGSSVKISGGIKNVKDASGISSYVDLNSPNIHKLGKWLDVDTSAWPQKLDKADIKVKANGSFNAVDMTTNILAMGGEVIAKGGVKTPFETPALNDLVLQLKHKNMAQAIQIVSATPLSDKNLQKPLDIYTKISQKGSTYTLQDIKGDLSGTSVTGSMVLDLGANVPSVKGALDFGKVSLESVMTSNSNKSSSARWSKEPISTAALHSVNADVSLTAQSITYGAWPLVKPKMKLTLKNGVLDITDLTSGVFDGNIALTSRVKSSKEARSPIHFENTSEFKNVDLGKLSKALLGTNLVKISGKGNLNINLKSAGVSPAALIYDLAGTGVVKGSDIILDGVDVTRFVRALSDESKPGDTVLGLWKGSTKGGQTAFDTLDGAFVIENGIVNINSMNLDGQKARIDTVGTIDLPKWYLSTKHKMSIKGTEETPSDVPPFEMTLKGSLDNPAQTFGQGVLEDYLGRKVQRKLNDLISKKLGLPGNDNAKQNSEPAAGGEPQQNQNSEQEQQKAPDLEDAAGKVLEGVLKDLLR